MQRVIKLYVNSCVRLRKINADKKIEEDNRSKCMHKESEGVLQGGET